MKKNFILAVLLLPQYTHAQGFNNLNDVLDWVLNLANNFFIPFLLALAILAFFWRNIVALAKKDELVQNANVKWYLLWAIIALFVMVSWKGLVGILAESFGIDRAIPQLNTGK